MTLVCPRCRRASALGETCPEHGLHGVTEAALENLDDAPLLGQVLNGQFALTDLIGQGGMGTVYRGLDLTLHRELAVKVLHAHLTAARKDRERFEREARALSRLRSGSTVTLFQFGVVREGPLTNLAFMVMEAVDGTSLARRLARGPLGLAEITDILDQLADSLGEAHQLGIVHRDLKPENILLTRTHDGRLRVKTIDFGIARLDGATRSGSGLLAGTPHYMAPEQCAGAESDTLDGRVDVYAVGVVLFQALTGQRPFDGKDPLQILVKQVNDPAPHLPGAERPGASQSLDVVVQRALAKDREVRYGTVGELARAFREAVEAAGVGAAPLFGAVSTPRGTSAPALSDTMAGARGALERRHTGPGRRDTRWRWAAGAALGGAGLAATLAWLTPPAPDRSGAEMAMTTVVPAAVAEPAPVAALPSPAPSVAVAVALAAAPSSAAPTPVAPTAAPTRPAPHRVAAGRPAPSASPAAAARRPSAAGVPRGAAPLENTPAPPPVVAPAVPELRPLAARVDEALDHCRCTAAQKALDALRAAPGGNALAAAHGFPARWAACAPPDVDEKCVDGKVHPR